MSGTRRADGPNKRPNNGPGARKGASKPGAKPGTKGPAKKRGIVKQVLGIGGPNDWRAWVQRFLVLCITLVLVCVGAFFVMYEATTIPNPNSAFLTQTSTVYYANGKTEIGTFSTQRRHSVSLSEVAQPMQDAVVAAEDRTFWTNKGIDIKSILRSVWNDAGGGATQGGSTITMQYVKILYLNQAQTIMRKIKQVFLALKIQKQESKQEILQGYLNTIYFGHGAYGVDAAAQTYFGIPASKLNVAQSAMLAAIVNQPSYLDPAGNSDQQATLLSRYHYVLDGMVKMGKLDAASETAIYNPSFATKTKHTPRIGPKPLQLVSEKLGDQYAGQNGFILEMVKQQLKKLGLTEQQIYGSGLHITTTLTPQAMNASRTAVQQVKPSGVSNLHAATASVDVKTGALLGFYAGQNFQTSQYNWASAPNPPGSVFKVPSLAMALSNGWSLQNTFDGNSPLDIGGGQSIGNEADAAGQPSSYGSAVSLLKGLEESINTVFVDMTLSTKHGAQKIMKTAEAMGVPADSPGMTYTGANGQQIPPATISLGSLSVSPINIANTYATVANGGMAHPWYMISKVTDSTGKVIWQHNDNQTRALSSQVAADVSYAMQQVVQVGTGSKNAPALGRPAGGKTGTATGLNNTHVITSWFAGFTPQVSTAVIYLRTNPKTGAYLPLDGAMPSYFGADYPTKTWAAVMKGVLAGQPIEQLPGPGNVKQTNNSSGHAALPTFTPSATNTPTNKPTKKPTHAPTTPSTSPTPSPSPTATCTPTILNSCNSPSP